MPVLTKDPTKTGWRWLKISFTQIGGGIQYPSDGLGGLAAGATAADRLAASEFAEPRRVLLGGWMVDANPATADMNLVIRDVDDTLNYLIDAIEVRDLATADGGNWDDRPWKFFPAPGLYLPRAFGVIVSGTSTAGAVNVLYKILD